jgi:hypothetical protein
VPGSDFGLPETLRLSYTCTRYTEGVDRLVEFFTGQRGRADMRPPSVRTPDAATAYPQLPNGESQA